MECSTEEVILVSIAQTTITGSVFTGFNKNGVHFIGGIGNVVDDSYFEGTFKTVGAAAQNGVVFMNGATGSVTNSTFSNLWYASTASECAGVLAYGAGSSATVTGCTFTNVQLPTFIEAGGSITESGNTVN